MTWVTSRISTMQFSLFNRQSVADATRAVRIASEEVSTGRKADIFADLGPRAATALRMRQREDDTQAYRMANGVLDNKLQTMLTSVDGIRDTVQDVMQNALLNGSRPVAGVETLKEQARAALESVIAGLNMSFNGDFVFGGTKSGVPPMTRWETVNGATGLSPSDVMDAIIGTGPTDAASAQAIIDELDLAFSSNATDPNHDYEATFYVGTPELDGSGNPSNRVTGRIDDGLELDYGVQGNDEPFRDLIKGLGMLANMDVALITDDAAYEVWMTEVTTSLGSGLQGALSISADIGFHQQVVVESQERLQDISFVQRSQMADFELVDPYEATTRLKALETQLEISYNVAARLSQLSILRYL